MIFIFNFGIRGAAIATVISEYVNDVVNLIILVYFDLNVPIIKFCQIFSLTELFMSISCKVFDRCYSSVEVE